MSSLFLAAVTTLLAIAPTTPATVGGWTTFLRPSRYSDLLARGDTVWCATREAGLLRFSRSGQRFGSITRYPNGLASNELSALAYDRSGRLWAGTYGAGASRMSPDGSTWALINAFDGLQSDTVNCLRAEGDTMWIGTPRGIAFWNGSVIAGSLPVFGQPSQFGSDNITGIVVRGDTLWVSTDAGAYWSRRSDGLRVWTRAVNGLFTPIISAMVTNDTLMFCLAGASVYKYVGNDTWLFVPGSGPIWRLFDDTGVVTACGENGIWQLTNNGWNLLNPDATSTEFDEVNRWIPAPAGPGQFLAAAGGAGMIVQPATGVTSGWPVYTPDVSPGNDVRNVMLDGDHVWVGSYGRAVGRFDGTRWRVWPPAPSPCGSCDTTFVEPTFPYAMLLDAQGRKWIATWDAALEEIDDSDPLNPKFRHHQIDDDLGFNVHTWMWSSTVDRQGGRWFGGDTRDLGNIEPSGLEYWSADSAGISLYRGSFRSGNSGLRLNKIHGLACDKNGRIWVGTTGSGIQTFTAPPLGQVPTFTLVPGSNSLDIQGIVARGDTMWVLTSHELQRYKTGPPPHDLPIATYVLPEGTAGFAMSPLAVSPDGSPWVGTEAGIRAFHPGGGSEDFNIKNSPIAGDQIYAIRIDPRTGVAWIATSSGLSRYDPGYRPPSPPQVPALQLTVYPNPISLNRTGIQLRLKGNSGLYRGTIYDMLGRKVGTFTAPANGQVIWDGRDDAGRMVKPGVYLVNVEAGGRSATVRVAVLR